MPNIPTAVNISPALPEGMLLGNYTIIEVIGSGGFGITYLAREGNSDNLVVIKENYPADISFRDINSLTVGPAGEYRKEAYDWALLRFLDEARTLSRLSHPNIVPIRKAFTALGTAYYVMPHVEGTELNKAAPAPKNITAEWLLPVLEKILSALDYIHAQGLIHRDIKPSNILLREDDEPVLIDFGTARALESTHSHTHIGTPGYMPIEQFSSKGKCGPWTDFYALGATCYHLITGSVPPPSTDRVVEDEYHPLAKRASLRKRFPEHVLSSIDKALIMNRGERWQSAQEWMQALKGKLTTKSSNTARLVKLKPSTSPIPSPNSTHPEAKAYPRPPKKKKKVLGILTILFLIGLGAGGYFYYQQPADEPQLTDINPEQYNSSLYAAAREGDAEKIRFLLKAGADVNWANEAENHNTALLVAVENKHVECVRALLTAPGINVNKTNQNGDAPLYLAADNGSAECMQLLLAAPRINVNIATAKDGWTPLIRTIRKHHTECMRLLLAAPRINVNQAKNDGFNPLIEAAYWGHTDCVRLLLAAPGLDASITNNSGLTALRVAEIQRHTECANLIRTASSAAELKRMGINPEQYNSSLYAAARNGDVAKIRLLLAAGANVNWANTAENNKTPLLVAVEKNNKECVRVLLTASDIDVNKANQYGDTPLYCAADNNRTECMELLLAAPGIDVNKANRRGGWPPLLRAVSKNHVECVCFLIAARGIDVNKARDNGFNALIEAAYWNRVECVRFLLAAPGIDVNITNNAGETALQVAELHGHPECARLLRAESTSTQRQQTSTSAEQNNSLLYAAARDGNAEKLRQLLSAGANVNWANTAENNNTVLIVAINQGHDNCVRILLDEQGIDINKTDKDGNTPLLWAATYGRREAMRLLLAERRIDVNMADKWGYTPLHSAALNGHTECVRLLLASPEINVNKEDKYDQTPLQYANGNLHTECARLIREAGGR